MAWERRRGGKTNHIWAIIMTSRDLEDKTYEWIDLGERRRSFFDLEVNINNNTMVISLDDQVVVDKDISYWYDIDNYYKVGLYLSDKESKGKTKIQFENLEYLIK